MTRLIILAAAAFFLEHVSARAETDLAWCHSLPGANAATCDIYPAKPLNDLHEAYNACVASGRERCEASIVGIMSLRRPEPLQRR